MEIGKTNTHSSPRILILYASKYGQTEKISHKMAQYFRRRNAIAETFRIDSRPLPSLKNYDGVLVGTPVFIGKTNKNLQKWVIENRDELVHKKTGLFTVSLNAADLSELAQQANWRILNKFMNKTKWTPQVTASLIGALRYTQYKPWTRFFLKRISALNGGPTDTSRDHELTQWEMVESFVETYIKECFPLYYERHSDLATILPIQVVTQDSEQMVLH